MNWLALPAFVIVVFLWQWHVDNRIANGGAFPFCLTITQREAIRRRRIAKGKSV